MNLIEQHMTNSIPIERWRAACISSEESNYVCGMMLVAAGLVDLLDGTFYNISTDNEYAEAFFDAPIDLERMAIRAKAGAFTKDE
jgi:hypothetical protein